MTLATLVGLLCNWKQERGATAQDRFQDFITWLSQHHHNQLCEKINDSTELQRELHDLLKGDLNSLSLELASITAAITSVASKLDNLSKLTTALQSPSDELTDQALSILKKFEEIEASYLFVEGAEPDRYAHIFLDPGSHGFRVKEPRFLSDDIDKLLRFGLLKKTDYDGKGQVAYTLSRQGSAFVKQAPLKEDLLKASKRIQHVSGGAFGY